MAHASPYTAMDFYDVDALLTEEDRIVRDTVRSFVDAEILPDIRRHFRDGTFPLDLIPRFGEMGLLGSQLEGYGCAGMSYTAYGVICREMERGDSGARSFCSVQSSLVMYPIHRYGSEEQKRKWLPEMAAGRKIGCFGLTEPDFGSNPGGMATTAKTVKGGFVLNGNKYWITNASIADLSLVWARLDGGTIRGFLVEKGTKGCTPEEIRGKYSLRASDTSGIVLEDCFVPSDAILPEGVGLKAPLSCLDSARYGIAWGAVGAAQACFDEALRYAKTRIQFDRPIASFQLVQNKFAEMLTWITSAQLQAWRLGRLWDEGTHEPAHTSLAKRHNVEMALKVGRTCRDILGASGITEEYAALRHVLNLESVITYEGTHDIHGLILGERITGIPAFKG
ncbi:MAG: acyl-CoA dehydrogenase family protein [Planctomycetes bacterium]|nr:acyl-CoA dehydrogenase family protein [Planctomycetota bacterium]